MAAERTTHLRLTPSDALLALLKYALLALGAGLMVLPFVWMIIASLMAPHEIMARPLVWLPERPRFENYVALSRAISLGRMYLNSLIVAVPKTIGLVLVSALAGYGFSRYVRAPGHRWLLVATFATMFVSFGLLSADHPATPWLLSSLALAVVVGLVVWTTRDRRRSVGSKRRSKKPARFMRAIILVTVAGWTCSCFASSE